MLEDLHMVFRALLASSDEGEDDESDDDLMKSESWLSGISASLSHAGNNVCVVLRTGCATF